MRRRAGLRECSSRREHGWTYSAPSREGLKEGGKTASQLQGKSSDESLTSDYSPYGTQMFFTCVAARRNSRPSPSPASSQFRSCHVAHVRFMFDTEASSVIRTPSRLPKSHTASTSS